MRHPLILSAALACACTGGKPSPTLEVRDAWARTADTAGTTAAYFSLVNLDTAPVTLSAESSPIAESASIHETMAMGGMVHMVPLDSPLTIPARDSLTLKQGAKHLMVVGLQRKLSVGDSLPFVLTFTDGRVLHASAIVRAP